MSALKMQPQEIPLTQATRPMLHVRICEARDVYNPQLFGRPDPYCIVTHNMRRHDTAPQRSTVTPTFNEVIHFPANPQDTLTIEIWNKNLGVSDEVLACCYLNISQLPQGVVVEDWIPMRHCRTRNTAVRVRLLAEGFGMVPRNSQVTTAQSFPRQQLQHMLLDDSNPATPHLSMRHPHLVNNNNHIPMTLPEGYMVQMQGTEPVVGTVMYQPHPTVPVATTTTGGDGGAFQGNGFVAPGFVGGATAPYDGTTDGFVMMSTTAAGSQSSSSSHRRPKSPTSCQ